MGQLLSFHSLFKHFIQTWNKKRFFKNREKFLIKSYFLAKKKDVFLEKKFKFFGRKLKSYFVVEAWRQISWSESFDFYYMRRLGT